MKLFEINAELAEFAALLDQSFTVDEETGEVYTDPGLQAESDRLMAEAEKNLPWLHRHLGNLENEQAGFQGEVDDLKKKLKKAQENVREKESRVNFIKRQILNYLMLTRQKKIELLGADGKPFGTFSGRKGSQPKITGPDGMSLEKWVKSIPVADWPERFRVTEIDTRVTPYKKAFEAGEELPAGIEYHEPTEWDSLTVK